MVYLAHASAHRWGQDMAGPLRVLGRLRTLTWRSCCGCSRRKCLGRWAWAGSWRRRGATSGGASAIRHHVTVVNLYPLMLERAAKRLRRWVRQGSVKLVEADAANATSVVGNADYDLVCCDSVLTYVERPVSVLRSAVSACRPDGHVSIMSLDLSYPRCEHDFKAVGRRIRSSFRRGGQR